MHALADKAAILAQQIDRVVAGRAVDAELLERLERLTTCARVYYVFSTRR